MLLRLICYTEISGKHISGVIKRKESVRALFCNERNECGIVYV